LDFNNSLINELFHLNTEVLQCAAKILFQVQVGHCVLKGSAQQKLQRKIVNPLHILLIEINFSVLPSLDQSITSANKRRG
jgi:hypothetical protein